LAYTTTHDVFAPRLKSYRRAVSRVHTSAKASNQLNLLPLIVIDVRKTRDLV